jgi:hypothetical protein
MMSIMCEMNLAAASGKNESFRELALLRKSNSDNDNDKLRSLVVFSLSFKVINK